MADLHILRPHTLGMARARKMAFLWAEQAEKDFDMQCTYEEGRIADVVRFSRSGVQGELHVTKDRFELDARLGFLLGAFKGRIEAEIVANLDALLAPATAPARAAAKKSAGGRK
ncbi:MAG: polyhydroxyalkanoic acid system family protein [Rhodoferax sp.]|nr:polyhydroxyalkanoic acid system family protein [Rhodoferax sp.]